MEQPRFGGESGEPVPVVDPEDLRAVWQLSEDLRKSYGDKLVATDSGVYERACKPGADIQAISYRVMMLSLLSRHAREQLAPWTKDGIFANSVLYTMATIPMEWIGVGIVKDGLPFDTDEFFRLCGK